jgi:hypothetical protein
MQWDIHTHSGGDYAYDVHEHGDFGTGAFTVALTDLPAGTLIYCRAYATNVVGTMYGDEVTFTTKVQNLKYWSGAAWITPTAIKYWTGASWTEITAGHYWSGAAWTKFWG